MSSSSEEVVARGMTMEARDSSLTTLQKQSHGVVDKLKVSGHQQGSNL